MLQAIGQAERFAGCLLGQAVADALAAPFESIDAYSIYKDFGGASKIFREPSQAELCYTDDTEMMIGISKCLIDHGTIDSDALAEIFAADFDRTRGYGVGAATILVAIRQGRPWRDLVGQLFPGGSYGNGAAMRAAPIGLLFHNDLDRVAREAAASASVTHGHPLGIDGAVVFASAVALLAAGHPFDFARFCTDLAGCARTEEFRWQLGAAARLGPDDSIPFGSGIEAQRSVVTAICCFGLESTSYERAITRALSLGGDVDTISAMTGALAGTLLGVAAVPRHLLARLENGPRGRDCLYRIADQLVACSPG